MQTQTFNDGVVNVYKIENIAPKGNKPKEGLTIKVGPLHYEERTVGMSRFWAAMKEQSKISQLIRVPRINSVETNDIAIPNDGKQYKIVQIQYPKEVYPSVMDLSLERVGVNYDIA